jgi:hypothetical protein
MIKTALGLLAGMILTGCTPEQQARFQAGYERGAAIGRAIDQALVPLGNALEVAGQSMAESQARQAACAPPHGTALIFVDGEGHFISY